MSDAVQLELFANRFSAVARDMGELLQRTALSTNIKERADFSCALLDGDGRLVVNAPHIPVHLGAMGLCVRRLIDEIEMEAGDTVVTNHPAYGGSHLPDVTVVTPIFVPDRERPVAFVANRAHHAEIGGSQPGSVPPAATRLVEEGVVIPPTLLLRAGRPRWNVLETMLQSARYPSRAVGDNLADLHAALAANLRGAAAVADLVERYGEDRIREQMDALRGRAAALMAAALGRWPDGEYRAEQHLDDGTPLVVSVAITGDRAVVDFAGSGPVHPGNLNATPAIVTSAVLFVLRLLVAEPLPLNEGLLEPVDLRIPPGILNPGFVDDAAACPAVVGGNVETSQRLVDTLLTALRLTACSQGTMNNVVFGGSDCGYYETVGGGTGAGPNHVGADAVHSHMTNTRLTDPEVLEHRFPVRLLRCCVRRGSGGHGLHRGGDGMVRELEFLDDLELAVLSQRRADGPCGLDGGEPGQPGRQRVLRADGTVHELAAVDGCTVGPGDRLLLETPGGGGWGTRSDC